MGKVICPRHGPIIGRLACRHISEATWRGEPTPHPVRVLPDLGEGPGKILGGHIEYAVCEECCRTYGLAESSVIDESQEEHPHPIEVFPVCPRCFAGS